MSGPRWVAHARLHPTQAVVVAPETVLRLAGSAREVLALCNGERTRDEIIATLTARHPHAPIAREVGALLDRLGARGLLDEPGATWPEVTEANGAPAVPTRNAIDAPDAVLCELTYRCPLRCGYCSNPLDLARFEPELNTATWERVLTEAGAMGVLHAHFSGGEPLLRDDVPTLVSTARRAGLYTNLITSAYGLDEARLDALTGAGLDHLQISLQDTEEASADRLAGTRMHRKKLAAARAVVARGVALSINVVLHRGNLDRVEAMIALASELGAVRLELANTQYHGWAARNRDALMPTRAQLDHATEVVARMRPGVRGRMDVILVQPDYFTDVPKPCMDGWGRRFVTVIPDGTVLPCPGAHTLPLRFDNVNTRALSDIWTKGEAFEAFRGTDWMREPCVSCDRREVDHGGCRCQAFALTGDARNADPACHKAPAHDVVVAARSAAPTELLYRIRTRSA